MYIYDLKCVFIQFHVAQCAFEVRFIKMKQLYSMKISTFHQKNFRAPSGRDISNHHQMPP